MKQKKVWFVIVTYKPKRETIRRLKSALEDWPVAVVDNTEKNLGYGAAANRGMKEAFNAGAQWVVVMNQDIEIIRKGISQFCARAQNCDPGIIGPEAGSLDPKRWTSMIPPRGEIDYISGSCMAIHRDVYERIGGFCEPYFMYYEDVDFCVRAKRAGFPLRQVTIDGFRHTAHGNEYYLARNHLWFVARLAPLSVKIYEILRLPKTLWEYFL